MPFDEFKWRSMTAAINQIKPSAKFLQDMIFKTRNTHAAENIDVDVVVGGRTILPFVSDVSAGTVVEKMGRKVMTIKAPRLRPKKPFSAPELLNTRAPGASFYGTGGDLASYRRERVGRELQDLKDNRINTSIEWMCAQALTGTLTVNQDDLAFSVDYQIPSANKPDISGDGAAKWNGTAPDIMGNLETWNQLIIDEVGFGADMMIVGADAWADMRTDSDFLAALDNRRVSAGGVIFDVNSMYKGTVNGVKVYVYNQKYTDLSDTAQNFVASDHVILVATQARFSVEFGMILDLDAQAQTVSEYFAKSWIDKDPSILWILAESRPLPVPWQPGAIVYAKVRA